ncbi:siderophore ABC transporter substrate-binding protein [Leucobacter ruminantium]|uniref:ABC transporter substrate-binding protein n=1 Tax=Leucobacter ruminantium TaxID=1289170 RepID=A0A939LVQ5_9MICO|nr:ABC transporter substrate-binding protein [Leucobacter ruminantium]MBO1805301.1 ABC transporter substrate-binding protein [Leucobacter ruminantium]
MTARFSRGAAVALTLGAALALSACASGSAAPEETAQADSGTVTVTDNHGEVEVPVNPKTVVALDNTAFDTLDEWDVELAAVPKDVMGSVWPDYTENEDVANVGNHREPNLEVIVAEQPDLIIGGYRFADYYDQIKEQNPQAAVIEIAPREGEDEFGELKRQTEILGQIFEHEEEAAALNDELDAAIAGAKDAYNGTDTVMAVNTSAGQIGYIAPEVGRSLGPVFPALGWKAALEVEGATNDHQGDDISVEAIAASNPDWIVALDRDAAFVPEEREPGSAPADELLKNSEALRNVTAVQQDQIVILDSDFYLTEGIQAYTELFEQLQEAFSAA